MNDHYNSTLKEFARDLRTETVSKAEKRIWKALLRRKQTGVSFKRQRPIDRFIVDFFSKEISLIIEIDGNSHYHKQDYDRFRQDKLESLGYTLIRYTEGDVLNGLDKIKEHLDHVIYCLR